MAWTLKRTFNKYGQLGNAAGVCEAAVCLWQRHIYDTIGTFQWGSSAGDWVPTPQNSNTLYHEFNNNPHYLATYQQYLQDQVFDPALARRNDNIAAAPLLPCCHYSGSAPHWPTVLAAMVSGDTLFVSLSGPQSAHAIGVYRGTDYIWVFDPNTGLRQGNCRTTSSCGRVTQHDLAHAAAHLQNEATNNNWNAVTYFGIHLRAPPRPLRAP